MFPTPLEATQRKQKNKEDLSSINRVKGWLGGSFLTFTKNHILYQLILE
jgi:hypothetical protein